ncbi:cytochrome P450 [Dendrothele bispora CBS 962.96]|uniref:Cytochrome P450 n=1 Tax=Dendrothele bispora (strain CBS 962.96) TaxID=1314807 RepID=A0A4S8LTS9_DENBC|nr:cytochrome P450 [Dendrothele bispora CBS 962.96]
MLSQVVFSTITILTTLFVWRLSRNRSRWSTLNSLPGPSSSSWWQGNFGEVFHVRDGWQFNQKLAENYGPVVRLDGPLGEKILYVYDSKALQNILVKEIDIYEESDRFIEGNKLVFGRGLIATRGPHHRKQRKILNPVFSIAHMRTMTSTFYEVAHKVEHILAAKLHSGSQEIDMLSWMGRAALEIVGQSGLGYSFDPMTEDAAPHKYVEDMKGLMPIISRLIFHLTYILPWAIKIGTPRFRRCVIDLLSLFWRDIRELRDKSDFMWKVSEEIYNEKKKALAIGKDEVAGRQAGKGKDILSVLMGANMKALNEEKLDEEEVIAQMSTLIFAAMDTTSTAMSHIIELLSTHPDIQSKLRQEIIVARREIGGRDLSYDELMSLPYLDAVCRETLRLFPPVPRVTRTTRQSTVLPLSSPVTLLDGSSVTELVVPKNSTVILPIMNANQNSDIWGPDAREWKPERWLDGVPQKVVDAKMPGVYSHLMTFIGGGRSCIGFKFSELEMKIVISLLLQNFEFTSTGKTLRWQMSGVLSPYVEGEGYQPQLPIRVGLLSATRS